MADIRVSLLKTLARFVSGSGLTNCGIALLLWGGRDATIIMICVFAIPITLGVLAIATMMIFSSEKPSPPPALAASTAEADRKR